MNLKFKVVKYGFAGCCIQSGSLYDDVILPTKEDAEKHILMQRLKDPPGIEYLIIDVSQIVYHDTAE